MNSAVVKVGKTRPLTSGNTDTKLVALTLNTVLNEVCGEIMSEEQRGFITGRSRSDSVLLCESAMGSVSLVSTRFAAIFLGFAAAFPSLSHEGLLAVPERAGVQLTFRRVVRFL